jgi:hypothetical protein
MIAIETTAAFPRVSNAGYFVHLLSQSGLSNIARFGRSVTVNYDGHGTRQEVLAMVEDCYGAVTDEKFYGDD